MRRRVGLLVTLLASSCGQGSKELLVAPHDAGGTIPDAAAAVDGDVDVDAAVDPTLGGPCVDDPQCDDHADCTFDRCDTTLHRCRNVPDDTRCDDGVYCNGHETCVIRRGCASGPVVTCEDGLSCTTDRCVEASQSCEHAPRDLDQDGDPDDRCDAKHDCNDLDPTVSSLHPEVCENGRDDNCDGRIDELPCVNAANDTCATGLVLGGPGTYALSSFAAHADYVLGCGASGPDVVATITVPSGPPKDVDVFVTAGTATPAVAIQSTCGDPGSDLACGTIGAGHTARTRGRSLAPGSYALVLAAATEQSLELSVDLLDATTRPTNETCANATSITAGTPFDVALVDATKDVPSACGAATGELTYSFVVSQPSDVRIFATTLRGNGTPVVSLRSSACTTSGDEIGCRVGTPIPLFARGLSQGTYVVTVAATAPIDARILVELAPATAPPADAACSPTPPAVSVNATMAFDLGSHESAIKDGCHAGGPTAAYDLTLANDSDVLVVGRFPANEAGTVSLDTPACTAATRLACASPATLARFAKHAVPAGDYRVVVADDLGEQGSVTTLVRDALPPTLVSDSDTCASVVDIPSTGGFFSGDTSSGSLHADFGASCDYASGSGAVDQILRLVLPQPRRVVLDMSGSPYTTLLDVRQGATCPGIEVSGACFVGFSGNRSFLDLSLAAGTYWVQVDGYAGATGPWNLDVRVLPP